MTASLVIAKGFWLRTKNAKQRGAFLAELEKLCKKFATPGEGVPNDGYFLEWEKEI